MVEEVALTHNSVIKTIATIHEEYNIKKVTSKAIKKLLHNYSAVKDSKSKACDKKTCELESKINTMEEK